MRPLYLTPELAEMIDIWADNAADGLHGSTAEGDIVEYRLAVLIRSRVRHTFPEIGESLKILDAKIRDMLFGSD